MPAKTLKSSGPRAQANGKPPSRQQRPPATASDYVSNEIRQGILDGTFDLGSRLDQQVLADRLGVSIIPIRESLRQLEAEGLVEILPRRGAFVAKLSLEEIAEVNTIRVRLEDLVLRLAAPRLDAAQLAKAAELNQRMARMPPEGQALLWSELNRQFHFMLYASANSPLLLQIIATLWDRSRLYREVNAGRVSNRIKAVTEHAEILHHLSVGDGAGAAGAVRKHIRRSVRDLMASEAAVNDPGAST
jgi:DNA-binding GntR family transcriptional regulator